MIEPIIVIFVFATLAAILVPNFIRARAERQVRVCLDNLLDLALATGEFSKQFGELPGELTQLTPDHLKTLPSCPTTGETDYRLETVDGEYTISCPTNHLGKSLAFDSRTAKINTTRSSQANPGRLTDIIYYPVACFLALVLFGIALEAQPEMHPEAETLLERHSTVRWINWFCWLLIFCGSSMAGCYLAEIWTGSRWLGLFGGVLGAIFATQVVEKGWALWTLLSPVVEPKETAEEPGENPQLSQGLRAQLSLRPRERFFSLVITHAIPALACLCLILALNTTDNPGDFNQIVLWGAILGVVFSFPLYLWGKRWAGLLYGRELEFVPGAGLLLLHSRPWGQPRCLTLGTVGEVERSVGDSRGLKVGPHELKLESEALFEVMGL